MNGRHALICSPVLPEFDRESGSRRIFDFVEYLCESGWAVSFVAQQAPDGERYVRLLEQRGVAVYVGFNSRVEQLIGAARIDLALLAFWSVGEQMLPLIRRHCPATPILIDSVDLHCLRNARKTFQERGEDDRPATLNEQFGLEMRRELSVYAAADGVLTVSQKEADLINDFTGDPYLAHVVPDAEDIAFSTVPWEQRKGILFVGNFRHAPNVGAVEYLCQKVLPLVDPALLAAHPVSIVGNALNDTVRSFAGDIPHVKMVGWVPSVLPYMEQARVKVIPLLYGAGTKRKLIQALMVGTPTVSTTIGVEGLHLAHEKQVLVADDPLAFARSIERLLTERELWHRLAASGRAHIVDLHGRERAQQRFLEVILLVRGKTPKLAPLTSTAHESAGQANAYQATIRRVQETVQTTLPVGANVLVVSKGDDKLLELPPCRAAHFPQAEGGGYAGHYPATGANAVAHLEDQRVKGSEYLLFPATSFWWLDHYAELRQHLEGFAQRIHRDDSCVIYRLAARSTSRPLEAPKPEPRHVAKKESTCPALSVGTIEKLRPLVSDRVRCHVGNGHFLRKNILVFGVYLANQQNTADHVVATLGGSRHAVSQRWVALFGNPPTDRVAAATVRTLGAKTPKFQILNDLLQAETLARYDYVLLADDDIVLPDDFLDEFIRLQEQLDFAITQPARTSNSYIDHPIVEQQRGVLARRTMFVEIGPVVSFHRSCFDLVFPFDLTSPMGWGYENVWSKRLAQHGLRMGIIDAVPVDHSLRKPVANYSWAEADRQRKAYLAKVDHYPLDECLRVLEAVPFTEASQGAVHG